MPSQRKRKRPKPQGSEQLGFDLGELTIIERSPAERVIRHGDRRQQRLEALELELERLSQMPVTPRQTGRPSKVLPPRVARLVWADVYAGMSYRAIVGKYENFQISVAWLWRVVDDGRLQAMCEGE